MNIKGKILAIFICFFIIWGVSGIQNVQAEIISDHAFENVSWNSILEQSFQTPNGVIQSICCTQDYIICLENVSDNPQENDIAYFFYKNTTDEAGNPVEQYSLAKTISNMSYEHCNGMTFNPKTNEIIISLYTNRLGEENKGSVYVMDASSFEFKRRVTISTDYNILGIDYLKDSDQYLIQTTAEGGHSFMILNSSFQIIDDLGDYLSTAEGGEFQDLCVDGDYIINFPVTCGLDIGDYIHMYSISRRAMVAATPLPSNWGKDGVAIDEPEGLCETAPGEFIAVVNFNMKDGSRLFRLYKATIPYNFDITTSIDGGTITESTHSLPRGENFSVSYTPDENYRINQILIDGQSVDIDASKNNYTFSNVQNNHTIAVRCVKEVFLKETGSSSLGNKKSDQIKTLSSVQPTITSKFRLPMSRILGPLIALVILGGLALYIRILYVRRVRMINRQRIAKERRKFIEEMNNSTPMN